MSQVCTSVLFKRPRLAAAARSCACVLLVCDCQKILYAGIRKLCKKYKKLR